MIIELFWGGENILEIIGIPAQILNMTNATESHALDDQGARRSDIAFN